MNEHMLRLLDRVFSNGGIVAYHAVARPVASPAMHVSPEQLALQLALLRDRYDVIPLHELLSRIEGRRSIAGCAAITFDDAYCGVATHALPLLKSLDLPATCFVTAKAAAVGRRYRYWWDAVEAMRTTREGTQWQRALTTIGLPTLAPTEGSLDAIRHRVLESFAGQWPADDTIADVDLAPDMLPLDVPGLLELAADPRIDFACHTMNHPALPMLVDDEKEREIGQCDRWLRDRFPRVRHVVAYPYGVFDRGTIAAAQRAGMRFGVSIEGFAPARHENVMAVPRLGVGERLTPRAMALRLSRAVRPLLIARHGRVDAA